MAKELERKGLTAVLVLATFVIIGALALAPLAAFGGANVPIYKDQGGLVLHIGDGANLNVENNGALEVKSGGELALDSGSTFTVSGNTLSATELGFLDGVTAGTRGTSHAVVLDANKKLDGVLLGGPVYVLAAQTANFGGNSGENAETVLASTASLGASRLSTAGTLVRVTFKVTNTLAHSTDTLRLRLVMSTTGLAGASGAKTLWDSTAIDMTANDRYDGIVTLAVRTAGATGTGYASGVVSVPTGATANAAGALTSIDYTSNEKIALTGIVSVVDSGNQVNVENFVVEVYGG